MTDLDSNDTQKPVIVYAEDNIGIRIGFETQFRTKGMKEKYELRMHPEGGAALADIQGLLGSGRKVILITDNNMKDATGAGMDGDELVKELHKQGISIPIMMVTARPDSARFLLERGQLDMVMDKGKRDSIEKIFGNIDELLKLHAKRIEGPRL